MSFLIKQILFEYCEKLLKTIGYLKIVYLPLVKNTLLIQFNSTIKIL